MSGSFSILDYVVFVGTLAFSMLIGVYYAFINKQKTNADLLVGGRSMPIIPTSFSLLATYMSAILVLGFAGEIYSNGTLIAEMLFSALIFIPLGGLIFLPTLYGLRLTSAYEYLGMRFKSDVVRLIATSTFIVQFLLYMGVVLYAPSLALNAVLGFPIWVSIVAIGGCAGIYTAIGGLKAVVWTDFFQILMMLSGMLAIIIQGSINVGGLLNAFSIANSHGRIEFFNFTVDPFVRHTSLSLFFGQGIFWLSNYGVHQTTVQRYCSLESFKKAFCALLLTAPLVVLTMSLAVLSGIVIFANFAGCDPITLGLIKRSDQIAPYFVLEYLSPTSGLMGLFIACLYSGSLSTVSSGLNSLAAVTWQDFFARAKYFRKMSEGQQGQVTKLIGIIYGAIGVGMGFLAQNLGGVLQAAIVVNGAVAGPLLGVFILGILLPFSNKYGAIVGMLLAHFITMSIGVGGLIMKTKHTPLPFKINNCSNETLSRVANSTEVFYQYENGNSLENNLQEEVPIEWPLKIFTISYLLYPLIGTLLTIIVGSVVSLCTGPTELTEDQEKYTHPLIVYLNKKLRRNKKSTNTANTRSHNKNSNTSQRPYRHKLNGHYHPTTHSAHLRSPSEAYFGEGMNALGSTNRSYYDNKGFATS